MFGVMNMREISEMIGWCVWFSIIGVLMLVCQLCRDRFEYVRAVAYMSVIYISSMFITYCSYGHFVVAKITNYYVIQALLTY